LAEHLGSAADVARASRKGRGVVEYCNRDSCARKAARLGLDSRRPASGFASRFEARKTLGGAGNCAGKFSVVPPTAELVIVYWTRLEGVRHPLRSECSRRQPRQKDAVVRFAEQGVGRDRRSLGSYHAMKCTLGSRHPAAGGRCLWRTGPARGPGDPVAGGPAKVGAPGSGEGRGGGGR